MKKLFFIAVILQVVSACTTTTPPGIDVPGQDTGKTILPDRKTSPAVVKLLEQARIATKSGDYPRAEVLLERTVRIEPRNAVLWHYLAKLRLHQERFGEAEGLAKKSNSLAGPDNRLKADNWRIIAHARHQSGNIYGAKEAQMRSDRLQQQ